MTQVLYELRNTIDERYCDVDGPHTEDGKYIEKSAQIAEILNHTFIGDITEAFVTTEGKGALADIMCCSAPYLVFSHKVDAVLRDARIDERMRRIPTSIVDRGGRKLADYWFGYLPHHVDALDYERSHFTFLKKKFVFVPSLLPPLDLFQTKQHDWIITQALLDRFIAADVRGCRAIRVWPKSDE